MRHGDTINVYILQCYKVWTKSRSSIESYGLSREIVAKVKGPEFNCWPTSECFYEEKSVHTWLDNES